MWALGVATAIVMACACTRTTATEPAALVTTGSERDAIDASLRGTWVTSTTHGDPADIVTELELEDGVATEVRREAAASRSAGEDTVALAATGHYAVSETGELDLVLTADGERRRTRATVTLLPVRPGDLEDSRPALVVGGYVPRDASGTAFRYALGRSIGDKTERAIVDVDFSDAPAQLLTDRKHCVVDVSIWAEVAGEAAAEHHSLACHSVPREALGLVEIVVDELHRGFVSDTRKRDGAGELASFVERSVDRSFFVDPRRPEILLRSFVGSSRASSWSKKP